MPIVPVVKYSLQWNLATKSGVIEAQLQGDVPHQIPVQSAEQFIAVALMLSKSPVVLDTDKHIIECPPRAVGS